MIKLIKNIIKVSIHQHINPIEVYNALSWGYITTCPKCGKMMVDYYICDCGYEELAD